MAAVSGLAEVSDLSYGRLVAEEDAEKERQKDLKRRHVETVAQPTWPGWPEPYVMNVHNRI